MYTLRIVLSLSVLTLISCTTEVPIEVDRFGYDYMVLEQSGYPKIISDSVHIFVSYSECPGNQEFILQSSVRESSEVDLWLFKKTAGYPCDLYVREEHIYPLPTIANGRKVFLVAPSNKRIELPVERLQ